MIEVGIISEVKEDKARVAIGSMVTDFLPVFQGLANSYAVSFSPIRVGEQVLVLPIRGELNSGVILRGIYQDKHKLNADDKVIKIEFEDGAKFSYDSGSKTLSVLNLNLVQILANEVEISGDLKVGGVIFDKLGDLTNHSHNDSDGAVSNPR